MTPFSIHRKEKRMRIAPLVVLGLQANELDAALRQQDVGPQQLGHLADPDQLLKADHVSDDPSLHLEIIRIVPGQIQELPDVTCRKRHTRHQRFLALIPNPIKQKSELKRDSNRSRKQKWFTAALIISILDTDLDSSATSHTSSSNANVSGDRAETR
jgi:hypothetical protein